MINILLTIFKGIFLMAIALGIMCSTVFVIDKICKKLGWDFYHILDAFMDTVLCIGGIGLGIFGIAVLAMIGSSV